METIFIDLPAPERDISRDAARPLLDWLTEGPSIPSKTLRRRAKLAARATLTRTQEPTP